MYRCSPQGLHCGAGILPPSLSLSLHTHILIMELYQQAHKFSLQEPKQFNDFLRHLNKFCQEKHLKSFTDYLASHDMMLISKTEAPERSGIIFYFVSLFPSFHQTNSYCMTLYISPCSDIRENEARLLLAKSEPKAEQ